MTQGKSKPQQRHRKGIVAVAVLAVAVFALLLAMVFNGTSAPAPGAIDSQTYAAELAAAMQGAEAEIGERLVTETDCANCHLTGGGSAAPLFDGLASLAGARRPPLSAEQYLYEAIIFPAAHLVEGYANAMPNNYGERYSLADLSHMIAYLLTFSDSAEVDT